MTRARPLLGLVSKQSTTPCRAAKLALPQLLDTPDPVLLRRALAHHTSRDGYLLALLHHRGDRRYNLDGQPVGAVTPEERAEALQRLESSTQRGQAKAEQVRTHKAREEKRRQQRAEEQRRREEKTRRKAKHERVQQEIAARKAALIAQGLTPESRAARSAASRARRPSGRRGDRRRPDPRPTGHRSPRPHVPTNRRLPDSLLAGRGAGHPDSPHLEPIVPNSGNRLRTKPFTSLYQVSTANPSMPTAFVPSNSWEHAASDSTLNCADRLRKATLSSSVSCSS